MLGSQRSHYHGKKNPGFADSSEGVGGKDECQVRLTDIERDNWTGTEIGRLGGYGFRGTVTAGDKSDQKGGEMEASYVNLQNIRGLANYPFDSLPLQQLALSPALMSCLTKQLADRFQTSVAGYKNSTKKSRLDICHSAGWYVFE